MPGQTEVETTTDAFIALSTKTSTPEFRRHVQFVRENGILIIPPSKEAPVLSLVSTISGSVARLGSALRFSKFGARNEYVFTSYGDQTFIDELEDVDKNVWTYLNEKVPLAVKETLLQCGYFQAVFDFPPINGFVLRVKWQRNQQTRVHCDLRHYLDNSALLDPLKETHRITRTLFEASSGALFDGESNATTWTDDREHVSAKSKLQLKMEDDPSVYVPYWSIIVLLQDLTENASEILCIPGSCKSPVIWDVTDFKSRVLLKHFESTSRRDISNDNIILAAGSILCINFDACVALCIKTSFRS